MKLSLGHIPANRITDPDLLSDVADQLPDPMRALCIGLDYHSRWDSYAFLASLDESLPDVLRRRMRRSDLRNMGVSNRAILTHIRPDGRDAHGAYWWYSTVVGYLKSKNAIDS